MRLGYRLPPEAPQGPMLLILYDNPGDLALMARIKQIVQPLTQIIEPIVDPSPLSYGILFGNEHFALLINAFLATPDLKYIGNELRIIVFFKLRLDYIRSRQGIGGQAPAYYASLRELAKLYDGSMKAPHNRHTVIARTLESLGVAATPPNYHNFGEYVTQGDFARENQELNAFQANPAAYLVGKGI